MADTPDMAAMVARLSSPQLGPDPSAPPPQEAAPPPPAPPVKPQASPEPTPTEVAVAEGSPHDEGDQMGEDAILYEIDGKKLTPNQIKSTFDRYRDLNFKHADNANLLKAAELAMQAGVAKHPDDIARLIVDTLKGQTANPTMGAKADQAKETEPDDYEDVLAKWEQDNAASLPPGYRDMQSHMKKLADGQQQLMSLLQQALSHTQGLADSSVSSLEDANKSRNEAIQTRIANNLEGLAQKHGLNADHANDFLIFAGERGYTLDDFIDPRLAATVMNDFKASLDSPELERMRQIAQRRQAFTGSMSTGPTGGDSAPVQQEGDPRIDRLAAMAPSRRNM